MYQGGPKSQSQSEFCPCFWTVCLFSSKPENVRVRCDLRSVAEGNERANLLNQTQTQKSTVDCCYRDI